MQETQKKTGKEPQEESSRIRLFIRQLSEDVIRFWTLPETLGEKSDEHSDFPINPV